MNTVEDPRRYRLELVGGPTMDKHRELVVTDAGDSVGPSHRPNHPTRQLHQHLVGDRCAVDRSEPGQVEGDHPLHRGTPCSWSQGAADVVEEDLPARQPCKSIAEGSPQEVIFRLVRRSGFHSKDQGVVHGLDLAGGDLALELVRGDELGPDEPPSGRPLWRRASLQRHRAAESASDGLVASTLTWRA